MKNDAHVLIAGAGGVLGRQITDALQKKASGSAEWHLAAGNLKASATNLPIPFSQTES